MTTEKLYLTGPVREDGIDYPEGHEVTNWPSGTIASLRGIGLIRSRSQAPAAVPKPPAQDASQATGEPVQPPAGDDTTEPEKVEDSDTVAMLVDADIISPTAGKKLTAAGFQTAGDIRQAMLAGKDLTEIVARSVATRLMGALA